MHGAGQHGPSHGRAFLLGYAKTSAPYSEIKHGSVPGETWGLKAGKRHEQVFWEDYCHCKNGLCGPHVWSQETCEETAAMTQGKGQVTEGISQGQEGERYARMSKTWWLQAKNEVLGDTALEQMGSEKGFRGGQVDLWAPGGKPGSHWRGVSGMLETAAHARPRGAEWTRTAAAT